MNPTSRYENFPLRIVLTCNAVPITIYVIGTLILAGLGIGVAALYLVFCLGLEYRLLKISCVNCYYYGKWCGFGKGKLSALLFVVQLLSIKILTSILKFVHTID